MTYELEYTLASAVFVLLLVMAYGFRVAVRGRVHFDRIERQGGSHLLSKGAMEIGYWILSPFARVLVVLGTSPNQVSWASLGFGALAGAFLAFGHFGFGAICATISGLLDSVDGMVARFSARTSDAGELLDAAIDRYVEFFFLSGLIVYYREYLGLQLLALLALLGSFMVSYSTTKAEALKIQPPKGMMRRPERVVYLVVGAALSAVTIPWFEPSSVPFSPVGYPMAAALGMVAAFANFSSIERFRLIAKALRRREAQPDEAPTAIEEKGSSEAPDGGLSYRPADTRV